jgi:hypothetical protein
MTFTRKRIEKYGLHSQKLISQMEARKLLKENGVVVNGNNRNCLFLHSRKETMNHFVVKSILFKILREKERNVGTEIEINNGIVDLIDLDNLIVYEIENGRNKKSVREKIINYRVAKDVFFIDCKKVPDNLKAIENYLRKISI